MMKLNYMAAFNNTGYGMFSKYLYKALMKRDDANVCAVPIGNSFSPDTPEDEELFKKAFEDSNKFHHDGHCLKVWHEHDLDTHTGRGQYLAYPFFEINKFNDLRINHITYPDKILTSCQWGKDILEQYRDNVFVVNPGVDTNVFKPRPKSNPNSPYRFIVMGKWEKRKGHDIIPEAFRYAFNKSDDVELYMHTYNPFNTPEENDAWQRRYLLSGLGDKIFFVETSSGVHSNIAKAINEADCGIYVSRAEGWNMELLETMACGRPVITTNYSAHTEYATKENSYLIDIDEMEPAEDGKFFFGQGEWAALEEDQIDQLVEYMRYCYKERPTNEAGIETAKQLSWENTAEQTISAILA